MHNKHFYSAIPVYLSNYTVWNKIF